MKIILSPAKKMITDIDSIAPDALPEFIEKTTEIQSWLKSKSKEELKTIWKCNDKITEQNFNRFENMDLYHLLTPAVLSYEGIAFQYMAPSVFEDSQFEYVQNHLRTGFVTARVCEVPESTGSIKKSSSELQPENKAVAVNRQAPARKRNFLFIGHSF